MSAGARTPLRIMPAGEEHAGKAVKIEREQREQYGDDEHCKAAVLRPYRRPDDAVEEQRHAESGDDGVGKDLERERQRCVVIRIAEQERVHDRVAETHPEEDRDVLQSGPQKVERRARQQRHKQDADAGIVSGDAYVEASGEENGRSREHYESEYQRRERIPHERGRCVR